MPASVPRRLDAGHLHAEADAEERHLALAGELGREDLAFRAALAEAAGHQDAVHLLEPGRRILLLEDLAVEPVELDLAPGWRCRRGQRLDQRFVGVLQADIFADDGDRDLAFRIVDAVDDRRASAPGRGFGASVDAEGGAALRVEAFLVIGERHVVDVRRRRAPG